MTTRAGTGYHRDPNDDLIELAADCQFDPDRWSDEAWDWGVGELAGYDGPRNWQRDINRAIRDHLADPGTRYQPLQISVASGHGIGKSAEMGMLSNWAMSCFEDCKIVTTANTEGQLRTKTAPEIGKWFRMSITSHWFDIQAMSIKSKDPERGESWRQDFIPWSEHNTEAFAGLHNKGKIILLLFDEASKIHDKVWEVAEGALTDENTVILWVAFGNPTRNSGRFRECFRRFRHRWTGRQIDSRTVPGTNKQFLQRMVDDHGEDSDYVKVRVRGQFPSQSAMQFISAGDADKARSIHLRREQYAFAPVIIGVDPFWTGDDPTVIMLRQGLYSNRLVIRKEKAAADLEALYDIYSTRERRDMARRMHVAQLGYSLSKWERIAIALNTGNEGNRQRLTDKRVEGSLSDAQVDAVLASLDERNAKFVQSVWDYLGSFQADIAAREKRVTGVAPEWVKTSPVMIGGKALVGGYYPLRSDAPLSSTGGDDAAQDISQSLMAGRFGKAQTRNGHDRERAQASGGPVELDMSVLHRHINQVIYDLELSEAVSNSWRIIQDIRYERDRTAAAPFCWFRRKLFGQLLRT